MEKRVALFLILSLLIVLGWNFLAGKMGWIPEPPPEEMQEAPRPAEPEAKPSQPRGSAETVLAKEEPSSPSQAPSDMPMAGIPSAEEFVVVETDLYRARFSNRGAVIHGWELAEYTTPSPEGPVPVELMYKEGRFLKPLAVKVADEGLTETLRDGLYRVSRDFERLDERHRVGHLSFVYRDEDSGVRVEKELTFHYGSYVVDVKVRAEGLPEDWGVNLGTNFGIVEWGEGFIGIMGPAFLIDEQVEKEVPDDRLVRSGPVRWLALQDKYFISALIPEDAKAVGVTKEGDNLVSTYVQFPAVDSAAMRLYAGPKAYDRLKALGIRLEDTIDFGWFIYGSWDIVRWIAKPLFQVLRFFHEYTQNYGFSIILLTVCIKLLFVPLQYKSYKSMKDMQVVQPKMQELQKKYKDDREKLNRELLKLYKDYKVNPLGGCLPMLMQMPVFIALFNILYMTIELRQAPFLLWITDLSVPDPFYVLPILMGASMVLQQKIMPTAMDPTQAKMMLMLPVFLTFIFLNFAAGLVLYWLTNNVLTIAQQFITDRYIFKRPTFTSLAAAPADPSDTKAEGDGHKASGKKKKKDKQGDKPDTADKTETDTPVQS